MKKSYIFFFNNVVGTRDQVKEYLNRMSTVITWRYDMTNTFYLISENTADEIAKEFEQLRGPNGFYIVTEYNGNAQGRLTDESWYLLNNKQFRPKSS